MNKQRESNEWLRDVNVSNKEPESSVETVTISQLCTSVPAPVLELARSSDHQPADYEYKPRASPKAARLF